MPHQRKEIGGGKPAGAAADHGDALAGGRGAGGRRFAGRVVAGKAFDTANIDRVVHHAAAAARLTGMLADIAADRGERVVLADQAHRVVIPVRANQGDVAGDIHARGAEGYAGDRLVQAEQAAAMLHMREIVLAEALHALQNHARGFVTDRAVCGILDNAGGFFDQVNGFDRGGGVKYAFEKRGELAESDAARNAFAAGLCMTQAKERERHIDRTKARGACAQTTLNITVQAFDNCLRAARRLDG